MRVTIKQIAEQSGVSIGTASRILSDKGGVHTDDTRERVLGIAQALGYRANVSARAVRSGKFNTVSLLLSQTHWIRSLLPGELLDGIHDTLAKHGQRLNLTRLPDEDLTNPEFVPAILREASADGLLINYNAAIPPRLTELIAQNRIPAVWINSRHEADCVYPDDFQAGYEGVQRLYELGHRHIGYLDLVSAVKHVPSVHYSGPDRCRGYETAMQELGLTPCPVSPFPVLPVTEWTDYLTQWLNECGSSRPTAFITYIAPVAESLVLSAERCGLFCPHDYSLLTLGGGDLRPLGLHLTSMIIRYDRISEEAVERLMAKIADPSRSFAALPVAMDYLPGGTCQAI